MDAVAIVKEAKTLGGFYQGKPSSPDTVKKTVDFQGIKIKVDRPKGFIMFGVDSKGNEWRRKYRVDYGFIPKTLGGDNDGLDVFIGPNSKSKKAFWAVQRHDDGSFDEYKIFLGFDDREEAMSMYRKHIPKKYFGRMITTTVEMMKAMLGTNPEEVIEGVKTAEWAEWTAFFDEMQTKLADSRVFMGDPQVAYQVAMMRQHPQFPGAPPPLTSLKHSGNKHLKLALLEAALQGTVGVGSSS